MSGNIICVLTIFSLGFASCSKDLSSASSKSSTDSTATSSSTISVVVDSAGVKDTVYLLQTCANGFSRDTLAESALPAAITTYLDTAYSGYTYVQGFVIKDKSGTVGGYVVVISYNGKPVGLLFSSAGVLVQVLEQRQAGDLSGRGWHEGGRYDNRDGRQRDTVALSDLPAAITSYFSSNYAADTLLKAFENSDSSYLVISKDSGVLYATLFTYSGTFVKREVIADNGGVVAAIDQSALPSEALSYLTSTYPDYVFEKAYSLTSDGGVQDYLVVIDADNTKYAVEFSSSGSLLSTQTIW